MKRLLAGTALVAASLAFPARGAAPPCSLSWTDAPHDTVYNSGTGLAAPTVQDDDLDALSTTVRATATDIVVTVTVARLNTAGPTYGTGHGLVLVLTKYGKTMAFAARKDATYGDAVDAPDAASVVSLTTDPASSTFTLTVRRSDLARVAGSPSLAGDLTGIAVSTIRYDHAEAALDATPLGAGHAGLTADDTSPGSGGTLSLDACDSALRATMLRASVTGPLSRRKVTATLLDGTGAPLVSQRVRVVASGSTVATATTNANGVATATLVGSRTVTLVYDGVPGAHTPARVTVRL